MSTIIDWHSHWVPELVLDYLSHRTEAPRVVINARGEKFILAQPWGTLEKSWPQVAEWHDIDLRLRHLDRAGVDRQLLSWPTTNQVDAFLPPEDGRVLWKAYNDALSQVIKDHHDRFFGVAMLPSSDIPWAAKELERAHGELGLIGAVLPVGGFQTLKGARAFAPIFEVAEKYRGHLYFHTGPASASIPGQPPNRPHADDDVPFIRWSLDTGASFAAGVVTLTQTGFLDAYPNVTLHFAMLGGSIPFLAESIELRTQGLHSRNSSPAPSPREKFRRVYFDSGVIGRGRHALKSAITAFGADRILFGSDFPPVPALDQTVAAVDKADLTSRERDQLFWANGDEILQNHGTPLGKVFS